MQEFYDIYNVEVTINKNGKEEKIVEKVEAKNDLHAMDMVFKKHKNVVDIKII